MAAYRKGDAAPEPSVLSSEGDAWRQLSVLLGERPVVGVMGGYFPQEAMAHYRKAMATLRLRRAGLQRAAQHNVKRD